MLDERKFRISQTRLTNLHYSLKGIYIIQIYSFNKLALFVSHGCDKLVSIKRRVMSFFCTLSLKKVLSQKIGWWDAGIKKRAFTTSSNHDYTKSMKKWWFKDIVGTLFTRKVLHQSFDAERQCLRKNHKEKKKNIISWTNSLQDFEMLYQA